MDKTPLLMLLATAVIGVYVLPAVTARFAGSHTIEMNRTGRIEYMQCEKCHTYIISELGATGPATDILIAHRTAATEVLYVGDEGLLNISDNTSQEGLPNENRSACMLCHLVTRNVTAGAINQTHTHVTIRVCTDDQCHGAGVENAGDTSVGNVANIPWATDALNVTQKLARDDDVHSKFFNPLDQSTSYYADQQGVGDGSGNYSRGFYACLACHTHVGLSFNLSRPIGFILNFSTQEDTEGMMYGFAYDTMWLNTTRNETYSIKQAGISIWS